MELFTVQMKKPNFNIYQIGDSHEGSIMQVKSKLKQAIDIIKKDRDSMFVYVGDCVEGRQIDDPYYESDINTEPIPYRQAEQVMKDFEPIASKCIAWLDGNHDLYSRRSVRLIEDVICKQMGVPYGTWSCKVTFKNGKSKWKAHFTHGSSSRGIISSRAGTPLHRHTVELNSMKTLLSVVSGDTAYHGCGHYHRMLIYKPEMGLELYLVDDGEQLHQRYTAAVHDEYIPPDLRWYGCSGAFIKQYINGKTTYAERGMYKPNEIGMLKLVVKDYRLSDVQKVLL